MMKNKYQQVIERLSVPPEWNERVIAAAQERHSRSARRLWLRTAVCTVIAAILLAGGMLPRRGEAPHAAEQESPARGMTVYAAGLGANGSVLLDRSSALDAEALSGTVQTLSLTFADSTEETGRYRLRTESLKTVYNENGSAVLVPALRGDPAETVSGLYAEPENAEWLLWPVEGSNTVSLSAPYGRRSVTLTSDPPQESRTDFHAGIDIPAERGTAVAAAADGVVAEAGYDTARGKYLLLDHGEGLTTLYGHCQELLAEKGDTVTAGDAIAQVGATGMATGPHLHFEVRQDGEAQNPIAYFHGDIRDTLEMG